MKIQYRVYSASKNILAVIEGLLPKEEIVDFCAKNALDGILCLSGCSSADVFMRICNCDGSEAEMCGNGLRVVVKHLFSKTGRMEYSIATLSGIYRGYVENNKVFVNMTRSFWNMRRDIRVMHNQKAYKCHFINTGVPHVVVFVDNEKMVDVASLGAAIRFSEAFAPEGVNVNFVSGVKDPQGLLRIRTYERGLERETGSCGTGATAAVLMASKIYGIPSPVKLITIFQECLTVSFDFLWNKVMVNGEVALVKEGTFVLNTHLVIGK